jgi:hypothetical protein
LLKELVLKGSIVFEMEEEVLVIVAAEGFLR